MKLTSKQIKEIQNSKESGPTLAKKYGVSSSTIYNHKNKKKKSKKSEIEEDAWFSLLSEEAVDMLLAVSERKQQSLTKAIANVLNWAAAAQQAGAVVLIDKNKEKNLSFAQKIKAKLKF